MKVKEESEKVGLKLGIQKTKIIASSLITSWQLDGKTVETVTDFIFGGSIISADRDCSHEIKRCLLLGRKAMTKMNSILKSRDITLPTKLYLVKVMVFQPIHPTGNQSWIFIGRTDAEAEVSILWLPDVKNWLIWKDPDAGRDYRSED